jgi:xanthine dehydrogenase accessory factor
MATAKLHSPAGIDISAKQPDEVAISIMAELIQVKNSLPQTLMEQLETEIPAGQPQYYSNPVCGVPVDMANPRHIVEYRDEKVYFCCDGCKVKFEKDPEKYIRARELGLPPEGM